MKTTFTNPRILKITFAFILFLFIQTGFAADPVEISIDVAPNVLNLQNQGQVVTVHTDIAYGLVNASTIYLNDVMINSWKSDDRGFFVAKFLMDDVKEMEFEIGEFNLLLMTGVTITGTEFYGYQEIKVINVLPAKKK